MPKRPWTEAETEQLREMMERGATYAEICKRLDRSHSSVGSRWQRMNAGSVENPYRQGIPPAPLPAEPQSAPGVEISQVVTEFARSAGVQSKPEVQCEWNNDEDIAELWRQAEEKNAKHIAKAKLRHKFSVKFDKGPIGICFASDQHIAPGTPVDMQRMRRDAELIRETDNLYCVLVGDGVDNHVKHRGAIIAARSQPSDQFRLYEYYLSILSESLLVMISGNHDDWTLQMAGVDMLHRIAESQRIAYTPDEVRLAVMVGECEYTIMARHQYRFNSQLNQCHTVKRLYDMGQVGFDIGVVAHHHEPAIEMFVRHEQERWACRPGSYQIDSKYSRQYGYNSTYPTCPTFILYPGERRIIGFNDLEAGVRFLRGERK